MSANLWNLKEKSYPRFNKEACEFQKKVIEITKSWGVDYENMEILEVGCGTGNYTFLLADLAARVYALDFSDQMLRALNEDANKLEISHKITSFCGDFMEFNSEKIYDIAFGAMTPALFSLEAFAKFSALADKKVWLGWAGKRESKLLSEIFEAHGERVRAHDTARVLKDWLEEKQIPYKNMPLDNTWHHRANIEDMVSDQAWHLKMHKIEPNLDKIREMVAKFADENGEVYNKTEVKVEVISW